MHAVLNGLVHGTLTASYCKRNSQAETACVSTSKISFSLFFFFFKPSPSHLVTNDDCMIGALWAFVIFCFRGSYLLTWLKTEHVCLEVDMGLEIVASNCSQLTYFIFYFFWTNKQLSSPNICNVRTCNVPTSQFTDSWLVALCGLFSLYRPWQWTGLAVVMWHTT